MDIVLRAAVAFVFVFLLTRVVGRRELSTFEPFDLILLVMIGDLVQQGVTQFDTSITGLMLAAGTVGLLTVVFSWSSFKFDRLRPLLDGEPIVLVQDGKVIARNARRERLTAAEIAAQARLQQISSLEDVQWAVLETNGEISFVKRSQGS